MLFGLPIYVGIDKAKVEMFRGDTVDAEILRFLRLKKKPIAGITPTIVSHLLHNLNGRLQKKHYLRIFHQCHTYHYYMELQILKFIGAVNSRTVFEPIILPARHETRCPRNQP